MSLLLVGSILALIACIIGITIYTYYKKPVWFKKIVVIGATGVLIGSGAIVINYTQPKVIIADWYGVTGNDYYSSCGSSSSHTAEEALNATDYWSHTVTETHWLIIKLSYSTTIDKVRGRSNTPNDPTNVNIYVSTDGVTWGTAVKTGITTWKDTTNWVNGDGNDEEIDVTDKDGQYIKIEITSTEYLNRLIFGKVGSPFFVIFDVYISPINYAPTQSNPYPSDDSTDIEVMPQLAITVGDVNENYMNITFKTNATGTWGTIGTNNSVLNGTYYQTNSSMSSYNKTYWWNVSVEDGHGLWSNATYSFTTGPILTSVEGISPYIRHTQLHATASAGDADNITLWHRYSTDNISWGGYGIALINTITTTESAIHGSCTDGEFIFGTSRGSGNMLKINESTGVVSEYNLYTSLTNGVDGECDCCIYIQDLDKIYILGSNVGGGGKQRLIEVDPGIDANDEFVQRVVLLNEYPGGLCYAFGYIWICLQHTLYRINPEDWTNTSYDYASFLVANGGNFHNIMNDSDYLWITTSAPTINPMIFKVDPDDPASQTNITVDTDGCSITDDGASYGNFLYLGIESNPGKIMRMNKTSFSIDQTVTIPNSAECFGVKYFSNIDVIVAVFSYNSTSNKNIICYVNKSNISDILYTYEDPYSTPNEFLEFETYVYVFHFLGYDLSKLNGDFGGWIEGDMDTSSPWGWTFLFGNGTGYYEFYSIGKIAGDDDEEPPGIEDALCYYSPYEFNFTVRKSGEDYFVWMDDNDATASDIAPFITGFNSVTEYIAIWDTSIAWGSDGIWNKYYGDGSGTDFSVDTYYVIRVYLDNGAGTTVIHMHSDAAVDLSISRTVSLIYGVNQGANYIGWTSDVSITASVLAITNITTVLDENEQIWWWNNATYSWEYYIVGFYEPLITIYTDNIIIVRVSNQETMSIGARV